MLNHADYTVSTRQHELDHINPTDNTDDTDPTDDTDNTDSAYSTDETDHKI